MQIIRAEVTPVELQLKHAVQLANMPPITAITAIFVRLETRQGHNAWGCTIAHPLLSGFQPADVLKVCQDCAAKAVDLHPTNIEYSLAELSPLAANIPPALCAFDLAFHDLLGLAADLPLYRLLGGYRYRIQTSITIPITSTEESVELALQFARQGFQIFKIKGGVDPDTDVQRVLAIRRACPNSTLRLDADGGYTAQQALDVSRALQGELEFLEQPTPPEDLETLRQVTRLSPIPVLADQSACGIESAFQIAAQHAAHGLSVKLASCGGLRAALQVDSIARAAHLGTMVSCLIEPALLTAAGLSLALASPNVKYGDLDGFLHIQNDPTQASFFLQDGWLIASDVPGLGYSVSL
ncbi:MAG: mandelate racemase/muconate lactonizing enzyme family protein [Chloroflexota bacterium]